MKELDRFDEALSDYSRAISLEPDNADALNNRAIALMEIGRIAEAQNAAEKAIKMAPRNARFYYTFGNVHDYLAGDRHLPAMESLVPDSPSLPADDRIELHFALAKAYQDLGEFENSFQQLLTGNELKRQQVAYDEPGALAAMAAARTAITSEFVRQNADAGDPSRAPVFIVGMPRSGSTLIEQMLASHRLVHGGGELKYFQEAVAHVRLKLAKESGPLPLSAMSKRDFHVLGNRYVANLGRLGSDAERITDKMTGNFLLAGIIHLALPNSTIIHTVRDPIDTCISCFSKLFVRRELSFTYDLGELGRYYRHYRQLMAHWRSVLPPGRILEVQYEDVVNDFEGQSRRIIDHCGLAWDPDCLAFHEAKRPVRTASAAQVRQPINRRGIGRWRLQAPVIGKLLDELDMDAGNGRAFPGIS